jgi:hypothetical protein
MVRMNDDDQKVISVVDRLGGDEKAFSIGMLKV